MVILSFDTKLFSAKKLVNLLGELVKVNHLIFVVVKNQNLSAKSWLNLFMTIVSEYNFLNFRVADRQGN